MGKDLVIVAETLELQFQAFRADIHGVIVKSFEDVANSLADEVYKRCGVSKESAIPGLRQQIIANVTVLVPYLKASSKATSLAVTELAAKEITFGEDAANAGAANVGAANICAANANAGVVHHGLAAAPGVHVITIGQAPNVRACVFTGGTAVSEKLIHSEAANDTSSALTSLLKKTEKMLASTLSCSPSKRTKTTTRAAAFTSPTKSSISRAFASQVPAICAFPVKKAPVSKVKAQAKTKHARVTSGTGFFNAGDINNGTFLEQCGEPDSDGDDSGFLSSDGEPHPNRSYVKELAKVAAPKVTVNDAYF